MTINTHIKSNDELKRMIQKAIEARKAVRKEMDSVFTRGWELKNGKYKLDWLIAESREELGRRKAAKCGAMKVAKDVHRGNYNYYTSCVARELSYNRFRDEKDLFRKHCCTCRWKPAQAQTRAMILRIKNGRQR